MAPDKDEIARYYGLDTYPELLAISDPLPKQPGDAVQSYIARRQNGRWFVWEDGPPPIDHKE